MTLDEYRQSRPQYNNIPDDQLLNLLRTKRPDIQIEQAAAPAVAAAPGASGAPEPSGILERFSNQLGDVVQSGVSAASKAASRAPGIPVDLAAAGLAAGDWGLQKLGHQRTPEQQARFEKNQKAIEDLQKTYGGEAWSKSWENLAGPYYQPQTPAGEAVQGPVEMVTSMATGPGTAASKVLSGLGAYFGGKGAETLAKDTGYEKVAKILSEIVGSYAGHRTPDITHRALATGPAARRIAGGKVGAAVEQHHPTLQGALAHRAELGPEAAVFNTGARPTGQAGALASLPIAGAARLRNVAHQQIEGAGPRLQQDVNQVFGPQLSRYQRDIDRAQQRTSQRPVYQQFRGHPIDITHLANEVPNLVDRFPQMGEANAALREVIGSMIDPRTGHFIDDAGELLGLRYAVIDPRIRAAGAKLAQPGQDIWDVGIHTPEGAALIQLRRIINDSLPPEIRQADTVLADEARVGRAYETGRKRIVGQGEGMIEPERLAAEYPAMGARERQAMLQGTSRAVNQMAGDVKFQRNAGTAVVNPLATPSNLARIETQVPGSRARIERAAARENALAGNASTVTANSATAQRLQGAKEFGADIAPRTGQRALEAGVGMMAAGPAGMALPVASGIYSRIINKLTGGRNTRIQDAAAELLAAQGGDADLVLRDLYAIRARMRPGNAALHEIGRLIGFFGGNPLFMQQMTQQAQGPR